MSEGADFAQTMRTRLQADLRDAMKRRAAVEISTLRCLIAAIDNAGAVDPTVHAVDRRPSGSTSSQYVATGIGGGPSEVARRMLSASDVAELLQREWRAREAAAITLERHGRPDETIRAEMALISRYRA